MKQRELARVEKIGVGHFFVMVGKKCAAVAYVEATANRICAEFNREISAHVSAAIKADRAKRKQVKR